ncbi:zinc finger protein 343 [Chanos chanos]|uniref:Zinc finger protein 343 n=1 Tax=Chanos chanos TaxID=29144 RepID=A0A6J2UTY4_CHACN|nr:zinc finger protein 343-like [Chanos chanos]
MDTVPHNCNVVRGQEPVARTRPVGDTLSKLAKLMAQMEYKQEGRYLKSQQTCAAICKECTQEFSDLASLARHQQRDHALRKPHRCRICGQEFALLSTLQLHKCLSGSSVCQGCCGKLQRGATCSVCQGEPPEPQRPDEQSYHYQHRCLPDNSPYACAPCGQAFSHKQELLYHQQAGECQPAPLSPKPLVPSAALFPLVSVATPTPSYASLPPSPSRSGDCSSTCSLCPRTFRSPAGLASHWRVAHSGHLRRRRKRRRQRKTLHRDSGESEAEQEEKNKLFPCRSCDKVFSQTSALYLHRREEHRRDPMIRKEQKASVKSARQRKKGETYPCLHCGKVFLHHLTRWAHFRNHSTHYQTHMRGVRRPSKVPKPGQESKPAKRFKLACQPKHPKVCKSIGESEVCSKTEKKTRRHSGGNAGKLKIRRDRRRSRGEPEMQEEDGEFPCPSCAEVFSSQSALKEHAEVHQPMDPVELCSVCTKGMAPLEVPEPPLNRVYHCVPCRQAFSALGTFLQHCQMHLLCSDSEDDDNEPVND